ncbi:hypothetical protein PAXRUDRAFT_172991, partial [Paxillus rubicundulus Ve08.2h10]
ILANPTGKEKKWRGINWCVELNNLFTNVNNGGKGPSHTVDHILLESPLVQVYWNIQGLIQKNFDHTHLTYPNIAKTFKILRNQLMMHSLHSVSLGLSILL